MRIAPPIIVTYGRSLDDARHVIEAHDLWNCEPSNVPWLGLRITNVKDLTAFALRFAEEVDFEGHIAIVPPGLIPEVEAFIRQMSMGRRVKRYDLAAVVSGTRMMRPCSRRCGG
jgi:hypothetical protein